jgi:hypothetical protein
MKNKMTHIKKSSEVVKHNEEKLKLTFWWSGYIACWNKLIDRLTVEKAYNHTNYETAKGSYVEGLSSLFISDKEVEL